MNIVKSIHRKEGELAKTASDNPLPVLCNLRYFKKEKLKWSKCLSRFHLVFPNCLEILQRKINFFKLCKKTPRTINSAKIPLSHLTERYLTNGTRMRVTYYEIFTRCHQGLSYLMGQSCDSICRNLPDLYPMFERPDKFLVTEVKILPFLLHL